MVTIVYALMHFFVDFICAWAMFSRFSYLGYERLLVYNFCAFALQMPLGTALDLLRAREKMHLRLPLIWSGAGVVLTAAGALTHPAVLGLGNALFHVGGGMDVIDEDFCRNRKGRDLGIFVAPGAIGLFLGTRMGSDNADLPALTVSALVLALLMVLLLRRRGPNPTVSRAIAAESPGKGVPVLGFCCFAVVVLRSFVGLSVSFSWKTGQLYPWLAVAAVALGKMSGGILAARFGAGRTVRYSLVLAAGCYLLGDIPFFGLAAFLLFNMSMPVTLYLLAEKLPQLPGFSFGLLTFGLFLGFLPVYGRMEFPLSGGLLGAAGSILSVLLLTAAGKAVQAKHVLS